MRRKKTPPVVVTEIKIKDKTDPLPDRFNFPDLLNFLGLTGDGVEVGVWEGTFAKHWIPRTNLEKIYLVDLWEVLKDEGYYSLVSIEAYRKNYLATLEVAKSIGDRVEVVKKDCSEVCRSFPDNHFDFVYIDASHEYQYIKRDLREWYPKVKKGGVFAGHDYTNDDTTSIGGINFGVKQAVDEFVDENSLEMFLTNEKSHASWYFML